MKSMNKSFLESVERRQVKSKNTPVGKSINNTRKPLRITINLLDDFESNVVLSTDYTYKNDTNKPIETRSSNETLNTTVNKSGPNCFNILTTKYIKIEEKLKKLSKEVIMNDSNKKKSKNTSMSLNKCTPQNNLSYINSTHKFSNKKKSSNFRRKEYKNFEKVKLNFSIDNKNYYGIMTPKINKTVKKESFLISSEKGKVKKSDIPCISSLPCFAENKNVIQKYQNVLNSQEIDELAKIPEVYYLGKIALRELVENSILSNEEQYTDENGNYIVNVGEHIYYRFEILSELGSGSFGQVIKCYDHKEKSMCCLKIIKNNPDIISQVDSEINILNYIKRSELKEKSNIVEFYENFEFRNHMCIKFEALDVNLYEYLKERNFEGIEENSIRKIVKQILYALVYMKRNNIIHCDLKPENILFKSIEKNEVKVIDFGSSCFTNEKIFTYIQSRFYRAPEVILEADYNTEIDMWSLGCIAAELFNGYPIFPGESEVDQFNYFLQYLGLPNPEVYVSAPKKLLFFNDDNTPISAINSNGIIRAPNTENISDFLNGASKKFVQFIKQCLLWEKEKRIKPEEALLHPWILESLPKKASKKKMRIDKVDKKISNNVSSKNIKISNLVSYQMNPAKSQIEFKNGITTKNTTLNTDKYSSPGLEEIKSK